VEKFSIADFIGLATIISWMDPTDFCRGLPAIGYEKFSEAIGLFPCLPKK
jgi:hypothetical protein